MTDVNDLFEKAAKMNGWMAAAYTDRYLIADWNPKVLKETTRLLDLRVFNKDKEIHLFRTSITKPFTGRDTSDQKYEGYFDEVQVLDIDTDISKTTFPEKGEIQTVTSGTYKLPQSAVEGIGLENAGIRIRHYINRYEDTGRAYETDFRCVGFEKVEVIENIRKEALI